MAVVLTPVAIGRVILATWTSISVAHSRGDNRCSAVSRSRATDYREFRITSCTSPVRSSGNL
jgi:hypothetical protein